MSSSRPKSDRNKKIRRLHSWQGVFSDGVTDARSPADELFTRKRLRSIFEQPFTTASEMLERVKPNLFNFIDIAPRNDDVTMLAVERIVNAG
ncbi:MAG: SpoIIE family protein phosphatase [Deltaproteobacteria bacterium]|nr:SpoIIE family protein phosphatase [Deltaproteobacteria bacterium]